MMPVQNIKPLGRVNAADRTGAAGGPMLDAADGMVDPAAGYPTMAPDLQQQLAGMLGPNNAPPPAPEMLPVGQEPLAPDAPTPSPFGSDPSNVPLKFAPQAPTPTPMPVNPAPALTAPAAPTAGAGLPVGAANGPQDLSSGTAQTLLAASQSADPRLARSAAGGYSDMATGYNWGESQEDLNKRRGLVIDPRTGAWEYPSDVHDYTAANAATNQAAIDDTSKWFQSQGGSAIDASGHPIPGTQTIPAMTRADQSPGWDANTPAPAPLSPASAASASNAPGAKPWASGTLQNGVYSDPSAPQKELLATGAAAPAPTALGKAPAAAGPNVNMIPNGNGLPVGSAPRSTAATGTLTNDTINPTTDVSPINAADSLRGKTVMPGNGPDRVAMLNTALADYDVADAKRRTLGQQAIGRKAAALGRVGAGMTTNDLTGLETSLEDSRTKYKNDLLADATNRNIEDQRANRAEVRGERGYTDSLESQAFDRARGQVFDSETLTNSAFNRDATRLQLGSAGNPSGAYANAAASAHASGANGLSGAVDLLGQHAVAKASDAGYQAPGTRPARIPVGRPAPDPWKLPDNQAVA